MTQFYTIDLPLSETQEAGAAVPVDGPATGSAEIAFDPATNLLTVTGSYAGLSSPVLPVGGADATGAPESPAHIHVAGVGRNGPIAFNLTVADDGDGSGSFSRTVEIGAEQRDLFEAGGYYINLHTEANPAGELRGQLDVDSTQFDIVDADNAMGEDQQVPEPPADGPATGNVEVLFDSLTNTLVVSGSYAGLSAPLLPVGGEDPVGNPESAIHIHNALAGQNGPILRNLAVTDGGDGSGSFEGRFTLTDEEVADLRADALYVNLHTEANPSGEIRGQLAVEAALTDIVTADLPMGEDQQVETTPPDGPATGEIRATLDAETLTLTVEGSFSGLTSPLMPVGGEDPAGNPESAVHIHLAPAGQNGPIFRNLSVSDNGDGSGGFSGSFVLESEAVARAFAADQYYVNLHTEANPSGELRGQIDLESGRFDDVTAGIPMSEDQEVAEVPVVDTDATGSYDVTFDSETRQLTVEGRFESLSAPLLPVGGEDAFGNPESAVHLHIGEAGENGPILTNLAVTDDGDGSGTFSGGLTVPEDRVAEFDANAYYVNLHTEANPGGELRGQLALSSALRDRTVQREETAGTSGDDALAGTAGNDVIRALPGDDRIADSAGDDLVDGGAGFDTFELVSGSADVAAAIGSDGETVLEGAAGPVTLVNTEAVALDDGTLRLDVGAGAAAGVVARLYEGVLGRAGEASGLDFWIDSVDAGVEAVAISSAFLASEEFEDRFGADASDDVFLDALYQNLRGGSGDEGGLAFWRDALDQGLGRAETALAFTESAEALENTADALAGGLFFEDALG